MTRNEMQKVTAEFVSYGMSRKIADRAAIVAVTVFELFYAANHPKRAEIRKIVKAFAETTEFYIPNSESITTVVEYLLVKFGYEEE